MEEDLLSYSSQHCRGSCIHVHSFVDPSACMDRETHQLRVFPKYYGLLCEWMLVEEVHWFA
jgi:hypothetical protein